MIADVKSALQKDGFILLLSIRPSVRMSAHTNVNILRQKFCVKFSFAYIFESFLARLDKVQEELLYYPRRWSWCQRWRRRREQNVKVFPLNFFV